MGPETASIFVFEDTVADRKSLQVRRHGTVLDLEPKAIRVLFYLIEHRDRVVSKDEVIAANWDGAFVTDNALTRVIAQLRKQLGDNARSPRFIETIATTGYRFIAPVREGEAAVAPPAPAASKRKLGAGLVALGVLAVVLGWWLIQSRSGDHVRLEALRQITTSPAADLWPTFSPDGKRIAFSSSRSGTFEIYLRSIAPNETDRRLTNDGQENIQPAWSPDGRYIAYVARRHGGIAVVSVDGGAPRHITDQGDTPAWSPDGREIAFRASSLDLNPINETTGIPGTTIWVVGVDGSSMRPLTRPGAPEGGHNFPHWNGSEVIFAAAPPWMVDSGSGRLQELQIPAQAVRWPAVSPDGRHLYYVDSGGGTPGLWHAGLNRSRASAPELLVAASGTSPRDLAVSPDGRHLAFSQQLGESAIWSVALKPDGSAAAEPEPLIRERSLRNAEPIFSPDGTMFAYTSLRQGGEGAVYVANADGSNTNPITAPDQASSRPSWFGSAGAIGYRVSRKGESSYWLMERGGKPSRLELKMDLRHADRMKFSPDGSMMAAHVTTPAGFQIVVEDLATHVVRRLTPAEGNYGFPCWSRDGNWIAAEDRSGGRTSLVYLPAKGGEIHRLNLPMTQTMVHDWSPDSTRIALAGLVNGVWNLYWVSRETGKLEQLTHFTSRTSFVRYPAWSPKNDRIVFERNDLSANIYVADLR